MFIVREVGFGFNVQRKWDEAQPFRVHPRRFANQGLELYREMYAAYAHGDLEALKEVAVPNLRMPLEQRISKRSQDRQMMWRMVRLVKKPRVLSMKSLVIPNFKIQGVGLSEQQAVVRIVSEQRLKGSVISRPASQQRDGQAYSEGDEIERGFGDIAFDRWESNEQTKIISDNVVFTRKQVLNDWQPWKILAFAEDSKPDPDELIKDSSNGKKTRGRVAASPVAAAAAVNM
jgi:hypothetical protein